MARATSDAHRSRASSSASSVPGGAFFSKRNIGQGLRFAPVRGMSRMAAAAAFTGVLSTSAAGDEAAATMTAEGGKWRERSSAGVPAGLRTGPRRRRHKTASSKGATGHGRQGCPHHTLEHTNTQTHLFHTIAYVVLFCAAHLSKCVYTTQGGMPHNRKSCTQYGPNPVHYVGRRHAPSTRVCRQAGPKRRPSANNAGTRLWGGTPPTRQSASPRCGHQ